MRVLRSDSHDPARNAALEEHFYRTRQDGERFLLLYRNTPCVVIGRNQNPCQETDYPFCNTSSIPILRRLSGGGAVYHDLQNLNYAFFVPKADFLPQRFTGFLIRILQDFGVPACEYGQHSIWADGAKISGNASALSSQTAMFHGCLLVRSDLGALKQALRPPEGIRFSGTPTLSVPAPVRNLASFLPQISPEALESAITSQFQATPPEPVPQIALPELEDKYRSDAWNWDRTPPFLAESQEQSLRHERTNPADLRRRWLVFSAITANTKKQSKKEMKP